MKKILALLMLTLLCLAFVACGDSEGTAPSDNGACTHENTEWNTKEPTCTMEGARSGDCPDCGEYIFEKLPAKGHIMVDGACTGCQGVFINNYEEFLAFAQKVNSGTTFSGAKVELLADIDLKGEEWTPIGTEEHPFHGNFIGNNHKITNLSITKSYVHAGLFGYVGGYIRGLNVSGTITTDAYHVGMVAGFGGNSSECSASGTITITERSNTQNKETYIGGVFGMDGNAAYCYSDVDLTVARNMHTTVAVGGVVGKASYVQSCYSLGDVSVVAYGNNVCVGGIIGEITEFNNGVTSIVECYSKGDIEVMASGASAAHGYVGGILGNSMAQMKTTISSCFVLGDIELNGTPDTTDCYGGAIAGKFRGQKIYENCYYSAEQDLTAPHITKGTEQEISDKIIITASFQQNSAKLGSNWTIKEGSLPTLKLFEK